MSLTWHHSNSMSLASKDRNHPSRNHSFGSCVCYSSRVMLCPATHTPFRTEELFSPAGGGTVADWELPSLEDNCLVQGQVHIQPPAYVGVQRPVALPQLEQPEGHLSFRATGDRLRPLWQGQTVQLLSMLYPSPPQMLFPKLSPEANFYLRVYFQRRLPTTFPNAVLSLRNARGVG